MMPIIPRQSMLTGNAALGSMLLASELPMWSLADAPPVHTAPSEYVEMAAVLTGIDAKTLRQDDLSLANVFYDLAILAGASAMNTLLDSYHALVKRHQTPARIADVLLNSGGMFRPDTSGTFARLTSLAWMYGTWYGGTESANNRSASHDIATDYQQDMVISGPAYQNAWIWRIARARPTKSRQLDRGSWASAPPSLVDYGISLV